MPPKPNFKNPFKTKLPLDRRLKNVIFVTAVKTHKFYVIKLKLKLQYAIVLSSALKFTPKTACLLYLSCKNGIILLQKNYFSFKCLKSAKIGLTRGRLKVYNSF